MTSSGKQKRAAPEPAVEEKPEPVCVYSYWPPHPKKPRRHFDEYNLEGDEALREYVMDSINYYEGRNRCVFIKTFFENKFSAPLLKNLELHILLKYSEPQDIARFIQESVLDVGYQFWRDFVLYAADFCFKQSSIKEIAWFRWAFKNKSLNETYDIFNNCIYHHPEKDAEIYVTCIMLFPRLTPKLVNKTFPAILRRPELPKCIELFMKLSTAHFEHINLKRDDATSVLKKYSFLNFERSMKLITKANVKPMDYIAARKLFLNAMRKPTNAIFLKIGTGAKSPIEEFLYIPAEFELKQNSEMFLTFFFCYVRLGLFEMTENTIMSWTSFIDDRWMNNNRPDLFDKDKLFRMYHWEEEFKNLYPKYLKSGGKRRYLHPFDRTFRMMNKMHEVVKFSEKNVLLKRFGYELFVQYFAIALGYCDRHERIDKLFHHNKEKVHSDHGKLCVYLNSLQSHGKRGNVESASRIWRKVMEICAEGNYVETHHTKRSKYDLPIFVGQRHAADISTRIVRNMLYLKAKKVGEEGFCKYGLLIMHLCDLTPDSFVNYNMLENMILRINEKNVERILSKGWEKYISTVETMNKIYLHGLKAFPEFSKTIDFLEIINTKRGKMDVPEDNIYLELQKKLVQGDDIFKCFTN